ncbi:hypothetical protein [Vibrio parahaemolyticus]|uniref:hypothetical protein n=1 Tax=Vibrio parahaemolyticus TaxID=670 RepID=UPI00387B98E0
MEKFKYKGLLILFLVVIVTQCILGFVIYFSFSDWGVRGTFGDMFGAVNTLFSGLAFCGVIYAIFLQGKELELQRQELSMTRTELAKAASAQDSQAQLMLHTAKINAVSSKLNTYTTLLVNKRTIPGLGGARQPLEDTLEELNALMEKNV